MQLVPVQIKDILSQDIDYTNPEQQELVTTNIVENIVQSEDLYPAEKTDKLIWVLDMFKKEKAYWETKLELAKKYVNAMDKMDERLKAYIRKLIAEEEVLYGTEQKIKAKDYKDKELSFIDESKLEDDKFYYTIKRLSHREYSNLIELLENSSFEWSDSLSSAKELSLTIQSNTTKEAFGISKLPKDHPAIKEEFKKLVVVSDLTQNELKGKR